MIIHKMDIKTRQDLKIYIEHYKKHIPDIVAFDTETDGLNIKHNKPFLISFGFITKSRDAIYSYTLDYEHTDIQLQVDTMYVLHKMMNTSREVVGHNITFDLHMQDNIGFPINTKSRITDTQIYIRLAHDALIQSEGGPPNDLKGYVTRYIDKSARDFQQKLKEEIKHKRKQATLNLKLKLSNKDVPEEYKVSGKEKQWTMGMLNEFFKDSLNEVDDLPKEVAKVFKEWQNETPRADDYRLLNRQNVTEYAHYDVIYTLRIWLELHPIIKERKQEQAFETEVNLIPSLYTLEKTGTYFDLDYAYKAKENTKKYIRKLRTKFKKLIGANITTGQHERIKEIIFNKYNINLSTTSADTLNKALGMSINEEAKEIFKIIIELRSLEKWYPTYILRWIKEVEKHGNILYPTYNATGAVTGRISSDFQQFPRDPLKTIDGEELFHPREMFITPKDYDIFFFDYAAMEMRLLAIYTVFVAQGDLNLCRVFKPFKCHIKEGAYYLDEDPSKKWEPLDPHGLTTKNAFDIIEEHPEFKHFRYLGKRANFAVIYGATGKKIAETLNLTLQDGNNLYNGFFKAFPKVRDYVQYVETHIRTHGYAENLFGRKYYGINAHKARNYLIQGSGADYTKRLLPELVELLKGHKSKVQGYLHDEFSFLIHKDEKHLVHKIKEIMEQLDAPIIMTVDVEYTNTNWREKHVWPTT